MVLWLSDVWGSLQHEENLLRNCAELLDAAGAVVDYQLLLGVPWRSRWFAATALCFNRSRPGWVSSLTPLPMQARPEILSCGNAAASIEAVWARSRGSGSRVFAFVRARLAAQ